MKKGSIDYKYNLKEYWNIVKKYKELCFILLFLTLITEAAFVADGYVLQWVIDTATQYANDNITQSALETTFLYIGIALVVLLIIKSGSPYIRIRILNRLDTALMRDLKRKYFDHLIELSHNFHTTNKTGSLISRLVRSGGAIESLTDAFLFNFAPIFFKLIITVSVILFIDWRISIIVIAVVVAFLTYSYILQRKQESYNVIMNEQEDREKAYVSDVFTNIDSIKYFGKERSIISKFSAIANKTRRKAIQNWDWYSYTDTGQSFILSLGFLSVLVMAFHLFLTGQVTIGQTVFILTTFWGLIWPMYAFTHGVRQFYRAMADFEVLFAYGKITNDIVDAPRAKNYPIMQGDITFDRVSFSYHKRRVVSQFSLHIKPGQKIALVGHSGSGKTTVVKLLYRLYDINKGSITIDGRDIKDYKAESLRSEMSIVPQEAILFDDTIYNNIAFSRPSATRKEVFKAIKFAQLDKIIKNFPQKEKTIVGERGVKLSGGEKQRVSIARAILADKRILALDEATSALDSQTEHEIQKDLEKLMKGRTSIIIAHRLSTIMSADVIVVMDKGKIVQTGSHKQLIKKNGPYKKLWNLQKGGFIE